MGMLEIGRGSDLLDESLGPEDGRQLGPQHLHRHLPMVLQVLGEVDRRHPTATEFALDLVAVGEGGFEAVELIRHTGEKDAVW